MTVPFDVAILTDGLPAIARGLAVTIGVWIAGVVSGLGLGLVVAAAQMLTGRWVRLGLRAYIEVFRGTPFLVQLFILYYGGPSFGLKLPPLAAGILALGLYGGAYFSEAFRSGFESIPPGQLEAAQCLGLSRPHIIMRIQFPQMLVIVLPALTNLIIVLCKETAVLSVVTVPELTFVLTGIGTEKFAFVETLLTLCVCYWVLVELASRLGLMVEHRVSRFLELSGS
jgi:polar amino acid transport system permease protein